MESDYHGPYFIGAHELTDGARFVSNRNRFWLYDSGLIHISSNHHDDKHTDRWTFCKAYEYYDRA